MDPLLKFVFGFLGMMIKKIIPLLEEYEETLESYHNDIEMTITIKPSKED